MSLCLANELATVKLIIGPVKFYKYLGGGYLPRVIATRRNNSNPNFLYFVLKTKIENEE